MSKKIIIHYPDDMPLTDALTLAFSVADFGYQSETIVKGQTVKHLSWATVFNDHQVFTRRKTWPEGGDSLVIQHRKESNDPT